jgi:hypothetical protein
MEKKDIFKLREKEIDFNEDQIKALLKIQDFLHSNEKFFLLAGYSGTGKTTILENVANYTSSFLLAPTNAAVKRLKEKIKIKESRFMTIHSCLFNPVKKETEIEIDEYGVEQKFVRSKNKGFNKDCLYIIDECSMIDRYILDYICKEAEKNKAKVIFSGDVFQLEPVGDNPMIFEWEKNAKYDFKKENKFELTKVQRYNGILLKVATHIRTVEQAEAFHFKNNEINIVKNFNIKLKNDILNSSNYVVLTATNSKRVIYNNKIRNLKYGTNAKIIELGERLICLNNNNFFCNSDIFYVGEVEHLGTYSFMFNDNRYKGYLIKHNDLTTFFVPDLIEPSLHGQSIIKSYLNRSVLNTDITVEKLMFKYHPIFKEYKFNNNIIIATYGYATSVNKAQGNEWNNVYIDPEGLFYSANKAKWFYTAITRAKKYVQIVHSKHLKPIHYKND